MTDTFRELLACMKCFHQMFKDDYELDGVAISSCGSIDVENAVIDAVWAQGIPCRDVIQKSSDCIVKLKMMRIVQHYLKYILEKHKTFKIWLSL